MEVSTEVSSETIIDSDINNLNYKDTWEDTKDTKVTQ